MGRPFLLGFTPVVALAVALVLLLRPPGGTQGPELAGAPLDTSGVRTTARVMGAAPPPAREDLIRLFCTDPAARRVCEHELMALYRACGTDLTHPRTRGCRATVARVRAAALDAGR